MGIPFCKGKKNIAIIAKNPTFLSLLYIKTYIQRDLCLDPEPR